MIIDNFKPTNKIKYNTSAVVSSYLAPLENKIYPIETGTKIQDFIDKNNLEDVVIYKDDMIVSTEYIAKENDVFYVYVIPESGSSGDFIKMAIIIAVAVYAPQLYVTMGGTAGTYGAALFTATATMATSYALNKWFPPDMPTIGDSFGSDSSTYGWGDTSNQKVEGAILPILYGLHRVKPPYINAYISTAQDGTQTLNQLFAIGLGEVESISDVVINNNSIDNYTNCTYTTRLGTKDQDIIGITDIEPDFTQTRTDFSQFQRVLTTDWYNFETNQEVEKFGLTLQFNGLGQFDTSGNIVNYEVECEAQYSTDNVNWNYIQSKDLSPDGVMSYCNGAIIPSAYTGVTTWTNWVTTYATETKTYIGNIVITSKDANDYQIVLNDGITYYRYNCSISWYTSPMDNWDGDSVSSTNMRYMKPITHSVNSYCYIASNTISNGTTYENIPSYTIDMYGMVNHLSCLDATQEVRTFYFETPTITPSNLYIRVRRKTADSTSTKIMDKSILVSSSEFLAGVKQRYPSVALLGIKALATDQLSGSLPTISALVKRFGKDETKPLNNPAWVCRDLIVTHLKGQVNEDKFEQWAEYCDLNGYRVNIYIETQMSMKRVIDMIASLGQGYVFQKGLTYDCRWEAYDTAPVQAFIFNDSNIAFDSYNEQYLSVEERFNTLEITYFDELLDYERNIITLQQDNIDVERKTNLVLYGCTSRDMAVKLGKIALRKARYETLVSSWSCDIDALHCGLYDIVYVQHSVPKWNDGVGSLIKSATTNTITLDQTVTLDAGVSYKVRVQHIDTDVVEEMYTVPFSTQTDTDTLTFTTNFDNIPQVNSKYTFKDGRYFKIINISKLDDLRTKITAIEYVPEIYNVEDDVSPIDYTQRLPRVNNVTCSEHLEYDKFGNVVSCLDITWNGSSLAFEVDVKQFVKLQDNALYQYVGVRKETTTQNNITIKGLVEKYSYQIEITDTLTKSSARVNYRFLGKFAKPIAPQNATASSSNGLLIVQWKRNEELDFKEYKIVVQGKTYTTNEPYIQISGLDYISDTLSIYTIDTSNVSSDATVLNYTHRERSDLELLKDGFLLDQAFNDGVVNIFFGNEPTTATNYDLWLMRLEDLTVDDFSFMSPQIRDYYIDNFETNLTTVYRYYLDGYWYYATNEQIAVIDRALRYITTSSFEDGLVRVFNREPFAPYDIGDLWLDGTEIKVCTTSKYI